MRSDKPSRTPRLEVRIGGARDVELAAEDASCKLELRNKNERVQLVLPQRRGRGPETLKLLGNEVETSV